MPLIRTTFIALAALTLAACAADRSPPTQPALAAVTDSGAITAVSAEGAIDVDVTVGTATAIKISCASELTPYIHLEVRDATLHIRTDQEFQGEKTARCVVSVGVEALQTLASSGTGDARVHGRADGLGSVITSGTGDVDIEDLSAKSASLVASGTGDVNVHKLSAPKLTVAATGTGTIRATGASDRVDISCTGSGDVDASSVGGKEVSVQATGSGEVRARASRRASVLTTGSGDVVIAGQPPERTAMHTGSGDVQFE